ncbi:dipicolinate synthase subunit DpsA [Domibacillus epiphyticus]|nr:dipicolinate synthase subunit DpsA [Domibacillus epiphyticus]
MNAVIFGGDARQLEISRILSKNGYHVWMIGFNHIEKIDHAEQVHVDKLENLPIDLFILPVSGVKEGGEVESPYAGDPLLFTKEIASLLPERCIIISGIHTPELTDIVKREILYLFDREDVAIHNSIPTAEGTLLLAIMHTPITIHRSNVVVVGLGRVGLTTARLFQQTGAFVKTAVREPGKFARAIEMGLEPFYMEELNTHIKNADIIINTVPSLVLTKDVIQNMKKKSLIIDLASQPGGTDFEAAKKAGIQAIHALGLPGKTAPETAGKILGHVIVDAAREWKRERGL